MLADWPVGTGLTLTLLVAALLLAPLGLAGGGSDLLDARVLAVGLAVAVLGSVLPFTLELAALRQLSAATFGILLSLEPAVAAFAGAVALSQIPSPVEALAIVLVIAASAGASLDARRVFLRRSRTYACAVEWAAYFDERTETMPPAWTRRLEDELLVDQVTRCYEHSPFWRRKLAEGGRPAGAGARARRTCATSRSRRRRSCAPRRRPSRRSATSPAPTRSTSSASTSPPGTTGKPLVLGYTAEDLTTSARIGARAFWTAGARPDDVLLHCLNYSFYTGGLVDHDSLEETGATMVPVGLGQSARLLELWDDLRPTALFSTLTYPLYLAETAQEGGLDPRALGLRKLIVAGEPGGQLAGTRHAPGGALGRHHARHLRALRRLGHVRGGVRGARRPPLLRPGRRPRRADRPGVGRAGGDRARGDRRAGLHAPRARGDAGPALPLPRPRGDPRRRVPLRAHRLPLPRGGPERRHVPGARRQRLPQLARGAAARARARPLRRRARAPSRSSRRSRSSSRASTGGRRSWPRPSRRGSASPASSGPPTLPRTEAKAKRLYRLYDGDERP